MSSTVHIHHLHTPVADRLRIPQQPQRQDSLVDQLKDLHIVAARLGMYDAADFIWKAGLSEDRHVRDQVTPRV